MLHFHSDMPAVLLFVLHLARLACLIVSFCILTVHLLEILLQRGCCKFLNVYIYYSENKQKEKHKQSCEKFVVISCQQKRFTLQAFEECRSSDGFCNLCVYSLKQVPQHAIKLMC